VSQVRARPAHLPLSTDREPARPIWEGRTRGSEVVALTSALTLTAATAEIAVGGHLRLFFDVCFVAICVAAALMVRPRDFFTVGVLAPLLMLGTMVLVALNGTRVIAHRHDSVVQAVVSGLAHHSVALFVGYAACLVILVLRRSPGRRTRGYSSKRAGSPAPRRTTSG
jgi:hypothetical protein